ncbi:hypothetical protein WR25_26942 [Diploscapter pachys]|uniref:Uncharacterized protein n=1 Tax=Diploscapter pachys TaxID=2018661 RepID=A0A2A2KM14_9BILA|nr:hypothetical protein WR25_26942 [Diploscapter pachys]
MYSPLSRVTPPASTATTEVPVSHCTPACSLALTMAGVIPAPSAAPMLAPRSISTTRAWPSPRMARSRDGSSVAVSIPVKPPPHTTRPTRRASLSMVSAVPWMNSTPTTSNRASKGACKLCTSAS